MLYLSCFAACQVKSVNANKIYEDNNNWLDFNTTILLRSYDAAAAAFCHYENSISKCKTQLSHWSGLKWL